jgi:UDP-N-acetylmuramoylalanine--D-glutamate ligase
MRNYKKQFKGKKITVMGLGILGRGLGYTKFLAECGADLIVTDLKTKKQLATSVKALSKFPNIKFVLGEHRLEDFRNRDMIMKAAGVPLDSVYIKEAEKNGILVEMDVSLFAKLAPEVILVGITGTRGKSMVTALIYQILKKNEKFLKKKARLDSHQSRQVYIGGNVRGVATLPLLKKVKTGDILVCELDSWQLQGFHDLKISPHISVFTSFMPDHMNYYGSTSLTTSKKAMKKYFEDKANIFKYQKKGDVLIIRPDVKKLIPKNLESKLIVVESGNFQEENKACAVTVAKQLNIPDTKIMQALKNFKGLEGRLQYIKTVKDVKIYNDNNATTPEATMAGIEALSFPKDGLRGNSQKTVFGERNKNIILICGGADKKLPLDNFVKVVNKYCKAVIMIPGTGTDKLKAKSYKLKPKILEMKTLKQAIMKALEISKKEDIILFSPAFASFGQFNNEYERGDLFLKLIKKLK